MANKLFIGFIFGLMLGALFLMKQPTNKKNDYSLLFVEPMLFRAMSGYAHTLVADYLWLLSSEVSEMKLGDSYKVNKENFIEATHAIVTLDPMFYSPVIYSVMYLTSIRDDVDSALEIIQITKDFDVKNYQLDYLEIMIYLTYTKGRVDLKKVEKMITKLSSYKEGEQIFGNLVAKDRVKVFWDYAQNKNKKYNKKIEDLQWLFDNTNDAIKKAQVKEKLDALKASKK
ncbi:MAG: hypothetical protein OEW60_03105 [Thiovulaceae bacterium]|nr:hypothetical protein [Sulfurimonadaceae bacterium]